MAAACRETHHPMRQRKYRPAIANSIYGLFGDLNPAISNGNALPFEAEEHRRCILNVDVEIRLRLGQRRGEVTEASVVEIKYRIKLASLHMEQGAVPPEMMHDIVGTRPMALQPSRKAIPSLCRPCISKICATAWVPQRSAGSISTAALPAGSAVA